MTAQLPPIKIEPQTPARLRLGGILMLILGLPILAIGGLFSWLLLDIAIPSNWLPSGIRIDEPLGAGLSGLQRFGLFALTAWMLAAGICSVLMGGLQLVLGRQSRVLVKTIIWLGVMIFILGGLASVINGCQVGRICQ
jgi:hypothetical protein